MKILTIGTGVTGTLYRWVLAGQGHDVTRCVRAGTPAPPGAGTPADLPDKRARLRRRTAAYYRYALTENLASGGGYDYILVAVRGGQLESLLAELSGRTGGACVVILTVGRPGTGLLEQYLPERAFMFAARSPAARLATALWWRR